MKEKIGLVQGGKEMLTYVQVMELFHGYLVSDACIEVVATRWGYVRIFCEPPYYDSFEAVLCRTPEELFRELLDSLLAGQQYLLEREYGQLSREIPEKLEKTRSYFLEKLNEGTGDGIR